VRITTAGAGAAVLCCRRHRKSEQCVWRNYSWRWWLGSGALLDYRRFLRMV